MRYKDKRGWLFEVSRGKRDILWTIYSYNPTKEKWRAWTCANWYGSKEKAEEKLKRFAKERGWEKVESDSPARPAV